MLLILILIVLVIVIVIIYNKSCIKEDDENKIVLVKINDKIIENKKINNEYKIIKIYN
jgi:cbb3-type cytochrome oxidase subunit 3